MSHSLGYGTSSGDLNTGGNHSESSFLEALFGLEFGHADFADFQERFLPLKLLRTKADSQFLQRDSVAV